MQFDAFRKRSHSIIKLVYDKLCSLAKTRVIGFYLFGSFASTVVFWYGSVLAIPVVGDLLEQTLSMWHRWQTKINREIFKIIKLNIHNTVLYISGVQGRLINVQTY